MSNSCRILALGSTARLAATVLPSAALNKNVAWSSSDPTVATVTQTGFITPLKIGKTVIYAKCEENGKIMGQCTIYVRGNINILASQVHRYIRTNNFTYRMNANFDGSTWKDVENSVKEYTSSKKVNCAEFVSWVYNRAGYIDRIYSSSGNLKTALESMTGDIKFKTITKYQYDKNKNLLSPKDYLEPGDIIMYGDHEHTEIYAGYENERYYTYNCGSDGSINYTETQSLITLSVNGHSFSYAFRPVVNE